MSEAQQAVQLGPDVAVLEPGRLLVFAKREMDDWTVREFAKVCIIFQQCRYYPRFKTPEAPPFAVRYELWPWPRELQDTGAGRVILYDEAYVLEREANALADRKDAASHALLLPFSPLIGFLPSAQKCRLGERYGISPTHATRGSLWLQGAILLLLSTFWSWTGGIVALLILLKGGGGAGIWTSAQSFMMLCAIAILAWDLLHRASQLLRDVESPDGIFEWISRILKLRR